MPVHSMRAMFVAVGASQVMEPVVPAAPHTTALVTPKAVAVPAVAGQSDVAIAETAVCAFQHTQLFAETPVYAMAVPVVSDCEPPAVMTSAPTAPCVVVNEVTASAVTSVVETHETVTAPAAGLAARLEVMSNEVAPTAIGAPTVVMVRTFPTDAAVCAPLDGWGRRRVRGENGRAVRARDRVADRELGGDAEGERVRGRGLTRNEGVERRRASRERGGAGAVVTGAEVTGAEVIGAEVTGAEVTGAEVIGAEVTGAEVTGAEVTGAEVTGAEVTGAEVG